METQVNKKTNSPKTVSGKTLITLNNQKRWMPLLHNDFNHSNSIECKSEELDSEDQLKVHDNHQNEHDEG